MTRLLALTVFLIGAVIFAHAQTVNNPQDMGNTLCCTPSSGNCPACPDTTPAEYTFMEVHVIDHGVTANEHFFLGPLQQIGEAVEMVYVGKTVEGGMKLQLRAVPWWKFWR